MYEEELLIRKAYNYCKQGYPIPLDVGLDLLASDVCPGDLEDMVEEGYTLNEVLDMLMYYNHDDYDEEENDY